ncbi:MAG: ATP-binding protein, partial [Leptolyngbya sp. Prado105]|nr:ATP-binding protein [Leptolyngbya sp. Prado105]
MTEKLTVEIFAGIKHLEIEIKRINILIGPQASGKSVCAKLLFYFKNFVWAMLSAVENEQSKSNLDSKYCKIFEEYFPPESWGNHDFLIRYEVSNVFIEVSRKHVTKGKVVLKYSDFFKLEWTKLRNLLKKAKEKDLDRGSEYDRIDRLFTIRDTLRNYFMDSLCTSIGKEVAFSQLFIPAGRSFFANLQSSIFSFLSSNNALDPFLKNFGSTYEKLKAIRLRSKDKSENHKNIQDEINKLIEESLCGRHVREKSKDFLELIDGRRIDVSSSSSGQQETLP